jgi:hypothetical protein
MQIAERLAWCFQLREDASDKSGSSLCMNGLMRNVNKLCYSQTGLGQNVKRMRPCGTCSGRFGDNGVAPLRRGGRARDAPSRTLALRTLLETNGETRRKATFICAQRLVIDAFRIDLITIGAF